MTTQNANQNVNHGAGNRASLKSDSGTTPSVTTSPKADLNWPTWSLGGTVWVLEDEDHEREVLVAALKKSGFDVRSFASIHEFRDAFESDDAPAAVLADINLKDGDFFQVFDDYVPLKIPTVILSGVVTPDHVRLVENVGGFSMSLIEKPAKPAVLAARVVCMVERAYIERGRADVMTIDNNRHTVYNVHGKAGEITKLDMKILTAIDAKRDYVVSITELLQNAFPGERSPSKEKLRVNISRLNKKLSECRLRIVYDRARETFSLNEVGADEFDGSSDIQNVS
jgi:DNA-binding response OmpR family regulator